MKQVPDRKRMRREYLRQQGKGTVMEAASVVLLPVAILLGLAAFFLFVACLLSSTAYMVLMFLATVIVAGMAAGMFWYSFRLHDRGRDLLNIPYVPPVLPSTLPAEEVLVRGSDETPTRQSEVLLRAEQGRETPKEELLRMPDFGKGPESG